MTAAMSRPTHVLVTARQVVGKAFAADLVSGMETCSTTRSVAWRMWEVLVPLGTPVKLVRTPLHQPSGSTENTPTWPDKSIR